jgi:hypothetical protein
VLFGYLSLAVAGQPAVDKPENRTERRSKKPGLSPEQALRQASSLWEKAQKSSARGKHSQAFAQALKGWQMLHRHKKVDVCRQLSDKIWPGLKQYGDAATRQHAAKLTRPAKRKSLAIE